MESWETGWEVGFPAADVDQLLLSLVVRDLVHGASFDVEAVEDGTELALDFVAGDELEGETYQLLLSAEIAGTENREMVQNQHHPGKYTDQFQVHFGEKPLVVLEKFLIEFVHSSSGTSPDFT